MKRQNKLSKKAVSIIIVIAVLMSTMAFSFNAFASSTQLFLNLKMTASISGSDDLEWFYYTPDESGMYSFLSYNVPKSECYLFIKERNPETGKKEYKYLDYSCSDPNYQENNHNNLQFCLTYHLEAGVTYYYAVGWYLSQDRTSGTTSVMLRCDSYDEDAIESIEISCPVELDVYIDGSWQKDASGESYFRYNTARLVQNSTVTVHFTNGTTSSVTGSESINGYKILYVDTQYENHWYPESDPNYNGNVFGIKILNSTASCNIKVRSSSRYLVKGKVNNMIGEPVGDAKISYNGAELAYTDSNGEFSFYMIGGAHNFQISTDNSIDRSVTLNIASNNNDNDFRQSPITICNCEYVKDGYINAKDFYYITKNNIPAVDEYHASINFTSEGYNNL